MEPNQGRELVGTVNLILAVSLIFFCLVFMGGIKAEKNANAVTISEEAAFAAETVAGAGADLAWRKVAEAHPELFIQAACSETRE